MIEQFIVRTKPGAYFLYPNGSKVPAKEREICNRCEGKWYRSSFASPKLPEEFIESIETVPARLIRKS